MKIIRKVLMNKNLITTISTVDSNIIIDELKQITEDVFEITLYVPNELLYNNYSIWESIFSINSLCYNSLNKKSNTLNSISKARMHHDIFQGDDTDV